MHHIFRLMVSDASMTKNLSF